MPGRTTTIATGAQSSDPSAASWTLDYDSHAQSAGLTIAGTATAAATVEVTVSQTVFGPVSLSSLSGAGRQIVATGVSSQPTFGESGGALVSVNWGA